MADSVKHIFLAEDDSDDFYIFSTTLREINSGVKLTWFETCEDLLYTLKTGEELPDLIILDLNIPLMGGQNCLQHIKENKQLHHIPVIILSTSNFEPAIKLAYEAGAHKYYTKAYSPNELRKMTSQILAVLQN